MKIAYVFRHDSAYVRSTKECNALVRAGHHVTYIGWNITPGVERVSELDADVEQRVLRIPGEFGRFALTPWLRWYWFLLRNVRDGRFDVVHCVDEYPVLMLLPFKRSLFRYIVLDVYDSIVKRPGNRILRGLFKLGRFLANAASDRIIETSDELRSTLGVFRGKAIVVMNAPERIASGAVIGVYPSEGPVRIAVTGALHSSSMAMRTLLASVDLLGRGRVELLCSGWLQDDFARDVFVKHWAVKYSWVERREEYFQLLARCDGVFNVRNDADHSAYRNLVWPNKVLDALAVGRPVIVSSRNWISQWVRENGLGYWCPPDDATALADIIRAIGSARVDLPMFSERSRALFEEHYTWELMEQRLIELYADLEDAV